DAECVFGAIAVDRQAVHELEHQVRLTLVADPGVDQARDVRVSEPGEIASLECEALRGAARRAREQFYGDVAFKATVTADRSPDRAHAAAADERGKSIWAELLPRLAAWWRPVLRTRAAHEDRHPET